MPVIAYLRVSTDQQDQASQREQIAAYCRAHDLIVEREVCDTASGSVPWQDRALGPLLLAEPPGTTVIVSEVSRLARSIVGVLTAIQTALERGINVIAARQGMVFDQTLNSKITLTVFAIASEIERDLVRGRTKDALAARKARGQPIGRQVGATGTSKCEPQRELIGRLLNAGTPKRAIARLINVSPQTLYDWLAREVPQDGTD